MRKVFVVATLAAILVPAAWAVLPAITTTLSAETADNTSAAPAFLGQANGNAAGSNISKTPLRVLLYPGSTTKLYAHVEPWWGSSHHIDIGYSSQDPSQVHRQVVDMISRGLDGAVADWYGPSSYEALGVKLLLTEAESHPGFTVFVEIDKGAVEWGSCYPTCNATTAVVQLITRVAGDFFSSPSYARLGGRPLLREFGMETISFPSGQTDSSWNVINWNTVQSQVPGNPLILHRNLGGFSKPQSGGAFGWMEPKTLDNEPANYDGTDELNWFYSNAVASYASMPAFGAAWKGFNDILADWAPPGGRHIEQNCGQSWLRTFAAANRYYSAANQLAAIQLVTWNDYEEGTEVESGIDNCVSIAASVSGTKLQWSITGEESTLDRYTVFISTDGENLAALGTFATGSNAVDLSAFGIPAGSYSLFVKAIGKPFLRNHMSAAVRFTVAAPPPTTTSKDVTIAATPTSVEVARGQAAQFTLALTQTGASDPVSLSCSNLPAGATCSFAPATLTPGPNPASVALTIGISSVTAAVREGVPGRHRHVPLFAMWMPGVVGILCVSMGLGRSRRQHSIPGIRVSRTTLLLVLGLMLALVQFGCGGGSSSKTPAAAAQLTSSATTTSTLSSSSYTVIVTATSGTVTRSTNVTVTIK